MPANPPVNTKQTNWLALVVQADSEHTKNSRIVTEYEFSSPGGGDPREHSDGKRIFTGDYQSRGPYAP